MSGGHPHLSMVGGAGGPCVRCGLGPLAPLHQTRFGHADVERLALIDRVACLEARIVKARDLAHTYRDLAGTTAPWFASIVGALAEPAHDHEWKAAA
jgi:hypothetical protein